MGQLNRLLACRSIVLVEPLRRHVTPALFLVLSAAAEVAGTVRAPQEFVAVGSSVVCAGYHSRFESRRGRVDPATGRHLTSRSAPSRPCDGGKTRETVSQAP